MGNSLRCCLACVLPCGALDLIRIVHLNGYVEEITRIVTAGEILHAYPNYVLSKPCSQGMVRKIMILSPDSELKRGSIYFLIPDSSLPSDHSKSKKSSSKNKINGQKLNHDNDHGLISNKPKIITTIIDDNNNVDQNSNNNDNSNKFLSLEDLSTLNNDLENKNVIVCDQTTKLKCKSKSGKHQRRRSSRGKSGIWQPHLESITEDQL
ncbi:hypothetical protein BVRB_7g174920 [Beta vulgaris subsp. vulgaris]|nr:hypothetical protein BVRB_7g174920 [Beta vulgaris subsp. vulgaris]